MTPDDRMELLMRLSPVVPADVDVLLLGLGWTVGNGKNPDYQRYHKATHAIAEMGIALRTNALGSHLHVHADSWPKARDRANAYYALMYPTSERTSE